ncbi:hypothetical protein DPM19_09935 [Actinomadura craniellae]|uniref:Uncharacterized protein n=1 Tax=Actinomadura craniellae TaxID=2231787 RepID=A0A365H9U9_9ACTN|nr:hypothetical protein [Actinomadura craniellae]RAY15053.1 hypothetical protein DPM19_09935 [Actinomadura craniellae]
MNRDLARGRALALRIMDGLDEELAQAEALTEGRVEEARRLRDGWRAGEPGDLFVDARQVELFTAMLAVARLGHFGTGYRPCPFDPYHGAAGTRALWTPPGSAPRAVTCCGDDAARLAGGREPQIRQVPSFKGMVPLWKGTDIEAHWLIGHHSPTGTGDLRETFRDTSVGRCLVRLM